MNYTTPRLFIANFGGKCSKCGKRFEAGDQIKRLNSQTVGCPLCLPDELRSASQLVEVVVRIARLKFERDSFVIAMVNFDQTTRYRDEWPVGRNHEFAVVGEFGERPSPSSVYRVCGHWESTKFGPQLKIKSVAPVVGATEADLAMFLAKLPQVGLSRAREIIRHFGGREATLAALENAPERLAEINGITAERAKIIGEEFAQKVGLAEAYFFCRKLGLPEAIAARAIETWGAELKQTIEADPYLLADLRGVTFRTADEIACNQLGVAKDAPRRLCAAAKAALAMVEDTGSTWATRETLTGADGSRLAKDILNQIGVEAKYISLGIDTLVEEGGCRLDGERIYSSRLWAAEHAIAERIKALLAADVRELFIYDDIWGDIVPAAAQRAAVEIAAISPVVVVTGGPGVGKTATTEAVCAVYASNSVGHIALCAPTGKAAIRIAEQTGREAKTIHRLLEFNPVEGFQRHEDNPIEADVVIIDEVSMVDTYLMSNLLAAIRTGTRVVFVGDADQLPSIGPGAVLKDIISSGVVPVARLTEIFRQKSESAIPYVAADINAGRAPALVDFFGDPISGVVFVPEANDERAAAAIIAAVTKATTFRPDEIQVLAPQKSGALGTVALNTAIQQELNPPRNQDEAVVKVGGNYCVRIRDRVIHTHNNYTLGVFNGEIGTVTAADPHGYDAYLDDAVVHDVVLTVAFPDREVHYAASDVGELSLAYAITVHKSQGSQFPAVVMPIHESQTWMLTRQLVYTGITRASQRIVLVGTERALSRAARNIRDADRRTGLAKQLLTTHGDSAPKNAHQARSAYPAERLHS